MRKLISIDVCDVDQFVAVSEDGLLWLGVVRRCSRDEAKKIGSSVKEGDKYIEWVALNGPKDGDPPWHKKLKFWDAMEQYYGAK